MIVNAKNATSQFFDVVIVGSGPAGISLALKLEKRKIKTLIIEAGGEFYDEKIIGRFDGKINGNFPNNLKESRLSQFGGSSGHWGGTCRTLDEYDFFNWPINKKDLDQYLDQSCNILEISNRFREKEINNDIKIIEFQESNVMFHDKYFDYIKKSQNIFLCLNAVCYDFVSQNKNVKQIKFKTYDGENFTINSKIFVLASGGIENSRLLLNIGRYNKQLISDMPVGKYWMEHPFKIIGNGIGNFGKIKKFFSNDFHYFENFMNYGNFTVSLSPTKKYISSEKILNSGLFLSLHERNNDTTKNITKNLLCHAPKISKKIIDMFDRELLCGITISSSWEQEPTINNNIELSDDYDFLGMPKIKLNYSLSKKTIYTATNLVENLGNLFINNNFGRLSIPDYMSNSSLISDAGYHHIGGTRIGNDPKTSVVNKDLKLHTMNNVFICGSSVFPSGGHANPTLSIVQLSLKLGDHISNNL